MVALFGPNLARLEVFFLEVFWWWPDGGPNGGIFVARIWPDWRYSTWRYFSVARCWPGWRYFSGPVLARLEVFFLEVFFLEVFFLEVFILEVFFLEVFFWPEFGPNLARFWPDSRYFGGLFTGGPDLARYLEVYIHKTVVPGLTVIVMFMSRRIMHDMSLRRHY